MRTRDENTDSLTCQLPVTRDGKGHVPILQSPFFGDVSHETNRHVMRFRGHSNGGRSVVRGRPRVQSRSSIVHGVCSTSHRSQHQGWGFHFQANKLLPKIAFTMKSFLFFCLLCLLFTGASGVNGEVRKKCKVIAVSGSLSRMLVLHLFTLNSRSARVTRMKHAATKMETKLAQSAAQLGFRTPQSPNLTEALQLQMLK